MCKIIITIIRLILACSIAKAGFLGSRFAYNAGFHSPLPFASEHNYKTAYRAAVAPAYGAPLPVAPLSDHYPYAAVGYSAPHIVRFRSNGGGIDCGKFTTYAGGRSHYKFAFPAPVPALYDAPPPDNFETPVVSQNDFESPNIVIKFGPPITTTTTSYSTTATAALVKGTPAFTRATGGGSW